jgi:ATP-binding cassette subfamily F protein uup
MAIIRAVGYLFNDLCCITIPTMNLISVEQISKTLSDEPLFDSVSLGIDQGDRIGLIGQNGAGKSTFLRILTGQIEPDEGAVTRNRDLRISMLSQQADAEKQVDLKDFLFLDTSWAVTQLKRFHQLSDSYTHTAAEEKELTELTELAERMHLWDVEHTYFSLLQELGLEDEHASLQSLSGGMRKKAALARALATAPNLLILDEPTNHLDISTIEWLESYILSHSIGTLVVTHDRYFLDAVCTRIFELDQRQIFITEGGYESSLEKRKLRIAEQHKNRQRLESVLRREMAWLEQGAKARTSKDKLRVQRVYDMIDQRPVQEDDQAEFSSNERRMGKKVLTLKRISKRYGSQEVIRDFSYTFSKGERIGLVGPNGSGKTTLLHIISQRVAPDAGTIDQGVNTVFGYYDQESSPLGGNKSVLEFLEDIRERITLASGASLSVPRFLEIFGFPAAMHRQPLSLLSGGERRRLYLVSVLLSDPNFLLLDEPTNDLDIETMERLESYLDQFSGCVLIVSHDRAFLDRTTDELFVFDGSGGIQKVAGSYSDYRRMEDDAKKRQKSSESTDRRRKPDKKKGLTFKEQKEFEKLLPSIDEMEGRKSELEQKFCDPELDPVLLAELHREYEELIERIEETSSRWETLAERAES